MSALKLSRLILIGIFVFVLTVAGYVSYQYYQHICRTEHRNYQESRQELRDRLLTRMQEAWTAGLSETLSYARRMLTDSEEHYSKGLKIIETSRKDVRHAFYVDARSITLPQWRKYRISADREDLSLGVAENPEFRLAEILEYQDNDYAGAVKLYEALWIKDPNDLQAANALARCLFKLGDHARAEKLYRQIYAQDPAVPSPGEVPLALTAAFQLLNLYQVTGNDEQIETFGLQLFTDLLDEKWELPKVKTEFYQGKAREFLKDHLAAVPRFRARFERALAREREVETVKGYVRFISERVIPFIEGSYIGAYRIYFLEYAQNRESFLLIAPQGGGHLVLELDYPLFIRDHLLEPGRALVRDQGLGLQILGAGRVLAASEPQAGAFESLALSKDFPDLKLQLTFSGMPEVLLKRRLERTRTLFLTAYGSFVLLLGLVFLVLFKQIQLAELKSDFVSHVSHELKTPLTSLRMFSEMLLERNDLPASKRRQYYAIMNEESVRLTRLIENLLDLSRIERRHVRYFFKPENLDEVLSTAVEVFRTSAGRPSHTLDLDLHSDVDAVVDKDAVIQMVLNLLDNARKYSPEGGVIRLASGVKDDKAVVTVADQGAGISRSDQRKVFRKFYQVKRTYEEKFKGVGLGLSIVKAIVQAHRGRIVLDSEPGRGTRVTLTLPLHRA